MFVHLSKKCGIRIEDISRTKRDLALQTVSKILENENFYKLINDSLELSCVILTKKEFEEMEKIKNEKIHSI